MLFSKSTLPELFSSPNQISTSYLLLLTLHIIVAGQLSDVFMAPERSSWEMSCDGSTRLAIIQSVGSTDQLAQESQQYRKPLLSGVIPPADLPRVSFSLGGQETEAKSQG